VHRRRHRFAGELGLVLFVGRRDDLDGSARRVGITDAQDEAPLDAHQSRQPVPQAGLVGQLEEEGDRQLSRPWNQPVVDLELVKDLFVGGHALGPGHLLHLEPHGHPVLEGAADDRPDGDASELLHGNDPASELVAFALVGAQVGDVGKRQLVGTAHHRPPSSSP
jgi:hypothetical protein